MNQCTSRPLVATVILFLAASQGMAQKATDGICGIVDCTAICVQTDLDGRWLDTRPADVDDNGRIVCENADPGTLLLPGRVLDNANLAVANILSQLDIDGDGVSDRAADTDGDGLPDNWEIGGFEALTAGGESVDRVVFYPAPSAIVPGTPPTPIFTRLAVATSALDPDTDGDGLSDFVEVFGLMFIDDNRNGLLDSNPQREWNDKNNDGLPSPGEYPIDNSCSGDADFGLNLLHDFDGFIFTDPTNPDTDGDGLNDGEDQDPLINLRAFGNTVQIQERFCAKENADIDIDGLGNAMDMGNDLVTGDCTPCGAESPPPGATCDIPRDIQAIDNPAGLGGPEGLISLFRQDLAAAGVVPEAAIEDLVGADWDGNGLWRITDVRTWHLIIDDDDNKPPDEYFTVAGHKLYSPQTYADDLQILFGPDATYQRYGGRGIGLGWQDLLQPSGVTQFMPDKHIWAILYAWRMPGFDIDGDGFVGVPNLASTAPLLADPDIASVALRGDSISQDVPTRQDHANALASDEPFDDRIPIGQESEDCPGDDTVGIPGFDGRIEAPANFPTLPLCGLLSPAVLLLMVLGLSCMRAVGARSMHRRSR